MILAGAPGKKPEALSPPLTIRRVHRHPASQTRLRSKQNYTQFQQVIEFAEAVQLEERPAGVRSAGGLIFK